MPGEKAAVVDRLLNLGGEATGRSRPTFCIKLASWDIPEKGGGYRWQRLPSQSSIPFPRNPQPQTLNPRP